LVLTPIPDHTSKHTHIYTRMRAYTCTHKHLPNAGAEVEMPPNGEEAGGEVPKREEPPKGEAADKSMCARVRVNV
jgi:hypothetical protein